MCGINGVLSYGSAGEPIDEGELLRTSEQMARRGPDGHGVWIAPDRRVGFAHRRLSIIDLSDAGAQPMRSEDGRLTIIFNGEIYNYRALRGDLERSGCRFRSQSDTEVMLHLYRARGMAGMLGELRGMFAFAIWDAKERSLFLARDPFGIKPLYYGDDGHQLRFASQVKALLKGGRIDAAPEPAGSVGFLILGHVPEPYTLYRGIRALPAGCFMRVDNSGTASITKYFDVGEEFRKAEQAPPIPPAEAAETLRRAVASSVKDHLVSDVPVGLFLSAGLDSTTISGLAVEQGGALRAVTLGFPEFRDTSDDEVPLAALVASRLGIAHEAHSITRSDFETALPQIFDAMDQPSIDGVNTYFVSRAAARAGMKVALSGLGGDELFGGYPTFWQVPRIARTLGFARSIPFLGRLTRVLTAPLVGSITSPKYAGVLEYGGTYAGAYLLRRALFMPWETKELLDPATVQAGLEQLDLLRNLEESFAGVRKPRSRIAALELSWYMRNQLLRDADWAGMAHSLEIRVPLVDVRLFRELAPLIVSEAYPTKLDFAGTLRTPLPDEVRSRSKSGFRTPVQTWMESSEMKGPRRGLRGWAQRVLPPQPRMFRALALVTDAFRGKGGIAKFNRDLISAIASMAECAELVVMPRIGPGPGEPIPDRIRFVSAAATGKIRFVGHALREAFSGRIDLVIAGHINLAPLSALLALLGRAPAILVIHGIDAWTRHRRALVRVSLPVFDPIVGVSNITLDRFSAWSGVPKSRLRLLPNCVDAARFTPGPKDAALAAELGLEGRTVIMTLGRLANEERYKGFDEVVATLSNLERSVPDISYLICGDGPDRQRLERKAAQLGVGDRVVFTGFVPESRKVDYYRLADAYVMPSKGEGFGIVFLEAMACGIPVMGSRTDGGREALRDGTLGILVDPGNASEVSEGILATLKQPRGTVPEGLRHYYRESFVERAQKIVKETLGRP